MGRQNKTTDGENGGASATAEANVKQGAAGAEQEKVPAIMTLEVPFEFEGKHTKALICPAWQRREQRICARWMRKPSGRETAVQTVCIRKSRGSTQCYWRAD